MLGSDRIRVRLGKFTITEVELVYADSLITIGSNGILFKNYGLLGEDMLALGDIAKVVVKKPTLRNGKWWIHGTGDFRS